MRVARFVILNPDQQRLLESRLCAPGTSTRLADRIRIVLRAAAGLQDKQIAAEMKFTAEKVARWRNRFLDGGLAALERDAPRPGRRSVISVEKIQEIVRLTTQERPPNATRWSSRSMAKVGGISEKSVRRIWRKYGLKPHLAGGDGTGRPGEWRAVGISSGPFGSSDPPPGLCTPLI